MRDIYLEHEIIFETIFNQKYKITFDSDRRTATIDFSELPEKVCVSLYSDIFSSSVSLPQKKLAEFKKLVAEKGFESSLSGNVTDYVNMTFVKKWLRYNHDLDIDVDIVDKTGKYVSSVSYDFKKYDYPSHCDTYEEAFLTGLIKALELLP